MTTIKLTSARYRVVVGDVDDPETWRELFVQSIGADQRVAESALARLTAGTGRRGASGSIADHAIFWTHLVAFEALRRSGQLEPGTDWAAFDATLLEVESLEDVVATPTNPDLGSG